MNPKLRRILFSLAVLAWGGVLLYFYASGRITAYLAPDFRPLALAGGLGLVVLGLFNLATVGESADCGHDHACDAEGHDHESCDIHPIIALIVMVVPLGLSVAWTQDKYSMAALSRKGLYDDPQSIMPSLLGQSLPPLTREEIEKSHSRTPDGYFEFNLMELYFAAGDRELQAALDGLKVETQGRWMDEKVRNPNGTRKRLYRLFMTCCVADSRAIPIVLEFGQTPPELPENEWVKVAGTMRFVTEDGILQPILEVERADKATPPFEETFLRY
jgi:uncharacterized repeat protein (TIGR03943 family)